MVTPSAARTVDWLAASWDFVMVAATAAQWAYKMVVQMVPRRAVLSAESWDCQWAEQKVSQTAALLAPNSAALLAAGLVECLAAWLVGMLAYLWVSMSAAMRAVMTESELAASTEDPTAVTKAWKSAAV